MTQSKIICDQKKCIQGLKKDLQELIKICDKQKTQKLILEQQNKELFMKIKQIKLQNQKKDQKEERKHLEIAQEFSRKASKFQMISKGRQQQLKKVLLILEQANKKIKTLQLEVLGLNINISNIEKANKSIAQNLESQKLELANKLSESLIREAAANKDNLQIKMVNEENLQLKLKNLQLIKQNNELKALRKMQQSTEAETKLKQFSEVIIEDQDERADQMNRYQNITSSSILLGSIYQQES